MWRISLAVITQECCELYWTSPGGNTPQSNHCTATYHPSRKLSKLDEPDMRDTAGEVGTNSLVIYSSRPLHMNEQKSDDQLEPIYNSSVLIQDVLWPRKGSLMKTQTRILDNWLYYTRKIELHRKCKKSRTVRITPILICPWQRNLSVLITVRRVHYGKMGKVPTTDWKTSLEQWTIKTGGER